MKFGLPNFYRTNAVMNERIRLRNPISVGIPARSPRVSAAFDRGALRGVLDTPRTSAAERTPPGQAQRSGLLTFFRDFCIIYAAIFVRERRFYEHV